MARPKKDPEKVRNRWDALYVTAAERASIQAKAAEADLSVSRYIVALHAGGHVTNRNDWRRNIQLLSMVTGQLELIARSITEGPVSTDAACELSKRLQIAASLLEVERLIRDQVMPWQKTREQDVVDLPKAAPC